MASPCWDTARGSSSNRSPRAVCVSSTESRASSLCPTAFTRSRSREPSRISAISWRRGHSEKRVSDCRLEGGGLMRIVKRILGRLSILVTLAALVASPSYGAGSRGSPAVSFPTLSGIVSYRYWFAHPDQAPPEVAARLASARDQAPASDALVRGPASANVPGLFTNDQLGAPQN